MELLLSDEKYLHSDDEFDMNGRASRNYPHEGEEYTIEEERVDGTTILRVLDEDDEIMAAATYMNGLEGRTQDEYEGHGEAVNHFDEFDNPLHAINFITYGGLSDAQDFSETDSEQNWGNEVKGFEENYPSRDR